MTQALKNFWKNESGAAVVDMTILMAGVVGLALSVTFAVSGGMEVMTGEIETTVVDYDLGPGF